MYFKPWETTVPTVFAMLPPSNPARMIPAFPSASTALAPLMTTVFRRKSFSASSKPIWTGFPLEQDDRNRFTLSGIGDAEKAMGVHTHGISARLQGSPEQLLRNECAGRPCIDDHVCASKRFLGLLHLNHAFGDQSLGFGRCQGERCFHGQSSSVLVGGKPGDANPGPFSQNQSPQFYSDFLFRTAMALCTREIFFT